MQSKNSSEMPSTRFLTEMKLEHPSQGTPAKNQSGGGMQSDESIHETNFEQGLRLKLERLKQFIGELGVEKDLPLNAEQLEQLQIDEEVYRNVGPQTVVQQTQKRIQKMAKTHKLKRNWSVCDLKILIWLICKHCEREGTSVSEIHNVRQSWELISSLIPGTTPDSCLFKWLSLKRHKITLHSWSQQEEQILIQLEKKYAESRNKWKYISEELYSQNPDQQKIYRHPKQCREHYASFLDPQIKKGPWTNQEDLTLLAHIIENNGEKKWCKLVKILEGRTQNAIKNRFQLIFAKLRKKKENKSKGELQLIGEYINDNGGQVPIIKKQRQPAVKSETPPPSFQSLSPQLQKMKLQEPQVKLPIIPTFNFCSSSRSLPSAFTPYLREPLYQQLPDSVYFELAGGRVSSKNSIEDEISKEDQ